MHLLLILEYLVLKKDVEFKGIVTNLLGGLVRMFFIRVVHKLLELMNLLF